MKIPRIEDLYFDDEYMANPGVAQGILESDDPTRITTAPIDDQTESVFYQTDAGFHYFVGQRPIMLAAANIPSDQQVMTDTGGGAAIGFRPALPKRPTGGPLEVPMSPAARVISKGATWLGDLIDKGASTLDVMQLVIPGGFDENKKISIPTSFKPQASRLNPATGEMMPATMGLNEVDVTIGELLKAIPVSELLGLRGVSKVAEALGTGNMPELFDVLDTIGLAGAGIGTVGAAKGVAGAAKSTVKALAPKAADMVLKAAEKTGMPVRGLGIVEPGPSSVSTAATAPTSDIGFFSAVEQAALNIKRNSGTGQAMLNDITKGENVKADEIKWIGLDEFLAGKKNVTKQEVQDFIAANKVDVQEVQLGGDVPAEYRKQYDQITDLRDRGGQISNDEWRRRIIKLNNEYGFEPDAGPSSALRPKFGAYTLPGGQNYREILLTMPVSKEEWLVREVDGKWEVYSDRTSLGTFPSELIARDEQRFRNRTASPDPQKTYSSSHWNEKNVLAHVRINDRVDADGKKMLLVEEVQSDWHQAGRDQGYKGKIDEAEVKRIMDLEPSLSRSDAVQYLESNQAGTVPDAPMKDTWYQLALKRVLKYAADNGYERVGLTTGSRQAERYDLSKQISSIMLYTEPGSNSGILRALDLNGNRVISERITSDKLADYIGKEPAKKLLEQTPVENSQTGLPSELRTLNDVDLKVGGEGMKKYYDDIYPNYLQKYGKKWGAKVGDTSIQADGKEPVRYIDITPEMRKSVGKGQPLFSAAGLATGTGAGTMATSQQEPK